VKLWFDEVNGLIMSSEHAHSISKIFQRDPLDCDAYILAMLLMQMRHVSVYILPVSLVTSPVFSSRAQIMQGTNVNIVMFPARSFIYVGSTPTPPALSGTRETEKQAYWRLTQLSARLKICTQTQFSNGVPAPFKTCQSSAGSPTSLRLWNY